MRQIVIRKTVIPKSEYDAHMAAIQALPPKKQKQWTTRLQDKWGVLTKCKYADGKIWNWSRWEQMWCIVQPYNPTEGSVYVPLTSVGQTLIAGDDAAASQAVLDEADRNYTGNHYRTKNVKVPRQSDGRVRG